LSSLSFLSFFSFFVWLDDEEAPSEIGEEAGIRYVSEFLASPSKSSEISSKMLPSYSSSNRPLLAASSISIILNK
jgi:hypothetical protein